MINEILRKIDHKYYFAILIETLEVLKPKE